MHEALAADATPPQSIAFSQMEPTYLEVTQPWPGGRPPFDPTFMLCASYGIRLKPV